MRKTLVYMMTLTLLIVSGTPMVSFASVCGIDSMTMQYSSKAVHQHANEQTQMADVTRDDCKIECACGCHSSIDALPQLLAPHVPIQSTFSEKPITRQTVMLPEAKLKAFRCVVESPPPRSI